MQTFLPFLNSLPLSLFDIVFVAIFLIYVFEDSVFGLISSLSDLFATVFAFITGLLLYTYLSAFTYKHISVSRGISDALAFFVVGTLTFVVLKFILFKYFLKHKTVISSKYIDRIGGAVCGVFSFYLMASFVVALLLAFPISEVIKNAVQDSYVGSFILKRNYVIEKSVRSVFGGAIGDVINFLTVKPDTDELVQLRFTVDKPKIDEKSEKEMLRIINIERQKSSRLALLYDENLSFVARSHGSDMLIRGYFSHYTPEGMSPFDRLEKVSIEYRHAGENIVLVPNVYLAMEGLMKSEGHKANILSPDFKKVGIGILDAGIYGKIFVQEFSD